MIKKNVTSRLRLSRETVRALDPQQLAAVGGGAAISNGGYLITCLCTLSVDCTSWIFGGCK
jgi:hypothetical protein